MRLRDWFSPPRHVMVIFLGVALVSAGALIFLVWLLLDQEKAVEIQRMQERLEHAADRTVSAMQAGVWDARRRFSREPDTLERDFLVIHVVDDVIAARPAARMAYYPETPISVGPLDTRLGDAERIAFSGSDQNRAIALFEGLSTDPKKEVRAAALNGLAQIHRKAKKFDAALENYDRLALLTDVRVDGFPAALLARVGKASAFEENHDIPNLQGEAAALREDLYRARWRLVKSEFEFYSGLARRWLGASEPSSAPPEENVPVAEVFATLWKEKPWERPEVPEGPSLRLMVAGGAPVLAMWEETDAGFKVALAGQETLSLFIRDSVPDEAVQCTLTDLSGKRVVGGIPASHLSTSLRTPEQTGLPWGLQLSASASSPFLAQAPPSRGLLPWLLLVAVVWGIGAWLIMRSISREVRVARLQSDFVAAVSHEFRSPLSSVGQIAEMLATDRFESEELRRKAYSVLTRESQRLRDLVESLLDFGRLEAGRAPYHFEPIEVGDFLTGLISNFQERVPGHLIEWTPPDTELLVRADGEALSRAVSNLLDNAVKYSPDSHSVWVDVERKEGRVEIAVRDRGLGIPAREQAAIFERFVRGTNVKDRQIKGTGVGLAMVRHIMTAHGGEVLLSSEPGQGSRFTLVLPEA